MKPAREWREELASVASGGGVELVAGRGGEPTLKVGNVFLHSRYNPREEAARLVDSADLDLKRPVLVIGAGLGYHVLELRERGVQVAVVEFDRAVAALAVAGPLRDSEILFGVGSPEEIAESPEFLHFVAGVPQVLIHPPTARLHAECVERMASIAAQAALGERRLRVAVVGPMYGGSLPIAAYLERGFRKLGHTTALIDNSIAWGLYQAATESVKTKHASNQLGDMLVNFMGEWSYARVAEFAPDVCIVMAQAPVGAAFPARLAKDGIITAFWYVENWRHMPYWREIAPQYDVFFHIQPGEFERQLDAAGVQRHAYVQTGCDPDIHRPVTLTPEEQGAYECDVSFAGAGYANRQEVFKGLTDYDFRIWGVAWSARELLPFVRDPEERFTPEKFAKIVAGSKINLNLHSSTTHDGVDPKCDAINPRVFEIAACGGFQICDPCIGLDTLYDFDTELPVYRDLAELRACIDHFLAHPEERAEFAQRARARALRDHTYEQRARQMLDVLIDQCGQRLLKKGVRVQRTMSEMADRVGRDSELGAYLATLPPDAMFTYENIDDLLNLAARERQEAQLMGVIREMGHTEKVLTYLREVRNFAETMLALKGL